MIYTTKTLIRAAGPCVDGWRKLNDALGDWADDQPIPISRVVETNGLMDALWALRCATDQPSADKLARLFACDCAERVLPIYERAYPNDLRSRAAVETARRFAVGDATRDELAAASAAARDAARPAAGDAALAAGWAAACAAAGDAARAAAWAADCAADCAADRDAESKWQAERLRWYLTEWEG